VVGNLLCYGHGLSDDYYGVDEVSGRLYLTVGLGGTGDVRGEHF
jgi:hypothetical protein